MILPKIKVRKGQKAIATKRHVTKNKHNNKKDDIAIWFDESILINKIGRGING